MKLIWTFFNLSAAVPLFRSAFDFIRNNGGLSMNFVENKRRPKHRNCPPFQTTLSHSRSPTPHRISKICIYKDIDSARHCSGSVLREGRRRGRGEGGCVCVCVVGHWPNAGCHNFLDKWKYARSVSHWVFRFPLLAAKQKQNKFVFPLIPNIKRSLIASQKWRKSLQNKLQRIIC